MNQLQRAMNEIGCDLEAGGLTCLVPGWRTLSYERARFPRRSCQNTTSMRSILRLDRSNKGADPIIFSKHRFLPGPRRPVPATEWVGWRWKHSGVTDKLIPESRIDFVEEVVPG